MYISQIDYKTKNKKINRNPLDKPNIRSVLVF